MKKEYLRIDYIGNAYNEFERNYFRCEVLNENTQQAQRFIDNYNYSEYYTLEKAYSNYSNSKARIWRDWVVIIQNIINSECSCIGSLYIPSKNSNVFTIGFYYKTQSQKYLIYITHSHNYAIKIEG